LAIFSIWISWRVLRSVLFEGIGEDKAWIQRQIRIAQFLVEYYYYAERNEIIGDLKPEADKHREHIKIRRRGLDAANQERERIRLERGAVISRQVKIIETQKGKQQDKVLYHNLKQSFNKGRDLRQKLEDENNHSIRREIEREIEGQLTKHPIYDELMKIYSQGPAKEFPSYTTFLRDIGKKK